MKKIIILFLILIIPYTAQAGYYKLGTFDGNDKPTVRIEEVIKFEVVPFSDKDWEVTTSYWKALKEDPIITHFAVKYGNQFDWYVWDKYGPTWYGEFKTPSKDISHITLYHDKCVDQVPLPGTLLLFACGLSGLMFIRRKK